MHPSLGYTGNSPVLDKEGEKIRGSRIPEGALAPRAERPRHGRSGELVNRETISLTAHHRLQMPQFVLHLRRAGDRVGDFLPEKFLVAQT